MVIVGVSSCLYLFRYEIYLLQRKYLGRYKQQQTGTSFQKYDAFLSFDDDNTELRVWIINVLVKNLEVAGYRIFLPCRDLPLGEIKEENILKNILNSKNYIVFLCDCYKCIGTPWLELEWKYIWHTFKNYCQRNIIIINYDQVGSEKNVEPRLRAFLRLRYDIDFSNRKRDLLKNVKEQLGPPLKTNIFNKNRKTVFSSKSKKMSSYPPDNTIQPNDIKYYDLHWSFLPGVVSKNAEISGCNSVGRLSLSTEDNYRSTVI